MKNKVNLGVFLALLSGLLWSLNTLLFSILIQTEESNIIIFTIISSLYNDSSSVIWLIIIFLIFYNKKLVINFKPKITDLVFVLSSIIGASLGLFFYILSILLSSVEITTILTMSYPILARLSSILVSKKYNIKDMIIFILLCITVLILSDERNYIWLPALMCALCWAIEGVICEYGVKNYRNPEEALMIRQITSTTFLFITFLLVSKFIPQNNLSIVNYLNNSYPIIFISIIGLVSYLFYYISISKIGAVKSMSLNISTAIFSITILNILNGKYEFKYIICSILIFTGTLLCIKDQKK
ncbi:EamA family transporter [Aggregatibacter actinomycetemcomitans]|uniref:EamA family transporter n=1 Tax=Aggregatibacter actinomycetemcomitans TaxID=714 RepID=UPI00197B1CD6|nr:EamA family transporter [Aggregatibacter actinomycetemcomitans]MBN6081958.1 EamA family transporter [Aggregatibacter actinomycetemcomitans]